MIKDVNVHAEDRLLNDYSHVAYPTVYFDGGFRVDVGSGSVPSAEAKYIESIDSCGNRPVVDLDVDVFVAWLGDATMYIEVLVQNNDISSYQGRVRVYVTEIISSMGWDDTQGNLYAFTFLDYAVDRVVSIYPESSWRWIAYWNGNDRTDGYGNNFGSITKDNVMVIAAVFNSERHQGYAYPPDRFPFDAYYVDEVAAMEWINAPPNVPRNPTPEDGATKVWIEDDLSWTGGDPDDNDTLTYDIYFGTDSIPPLVFSNHPDTSYDPGTMMYETTYYWQIVAWDNHDTSRVGPIWLFTAGPEWIIGDCNRDREITISDAVYLLNYILKDGPEPDPVESGNVNCDEEVVINDVVYLINYLFRDGPPPCDQ
ncbi:MAG: dockerin type I domain-containing protein [Candidatus Zixiibacteriota bacterium]